MDNLDTLKQMIRAVAEGILQGRVYEHALICPGCRVAPCERAKALDEELKLARREGKAARAKGKATK